MVVSTIINHRLSGILFAEIPDYFGRSTNLEIAAFTFSINIIFIVDAGHGLCFIS